MRNNALRTRWKPWTWSSRSWVIVSVVAFVASPFVTRWTCLWQVPDVVLPFDVEEVIHTEVPKNEDAFIVYADLLNWINASVAKQRNAGTAPSEPQSEISSEEIARRLSHDDRQLLAEYMRAGKLEHAVGPSLKTATIGTGLPLHQELRQLVRHFRSLGDAMIASGDIDGAWACYQANLQCSIHAEKPCLVIPALIATALRFYTAEGIVSWASNRSISAERLRAARVDVEREYARRVPISHVFTAEYLCLRNSVKQLEIVDSFIPNPGGTPSSMPLLVGKRAFLWVLGQPQLSLRTYEQFLLNNRIDIDKPPHLRRHSTIQNGIYVFDRDPDRPRQPGELDPEQLRRTLQSNAYVLRISQSIFPAWAVMDEVRCRDTARLALLRVIFAAHEFQRTHGEFPETIEQLVPAHLDELPIDPFSAEGASIKYRREANGTATVWSIGRNGIDDQGNIDSNDPPDIGYLIKLTHSD